MSIICANNWATDLGRSPRTFNTTPGPTAREDMVIVLKKQARGASSMLRRRHFEMSKQHEFTDEIVKGVQLNHAYMRTKTDSSTTKTDTFIKERKNTQHVYSEQFKRTPRASRPFTAIPRCGMSDIYSSKDTLAFVEDTLKIMSISKHRSTKGIIFSDASRCTHTKLHKQIRIDTAVINSYNSTKQPPTTIVRAKSAPPFAFATLNGPHRTPEQHSQLPLFWRTRNNYHSKQSIELIHNDTNETPHRQGVQLRALLQNKGDTYYKEKLNCPYDCRSCFKACLASEAYIQNHLERKRCQTESAE